MGTWKDFGQTRHVDARTLDLNTALLCPLIRLVHPLSVPSILLDISPSMARLCGLCLRAFAMVRGFAQHRNHYHRRPKPLRPRSIFCYHPHLTGESQIHLQFTSVSASTSEKTQAQLAIAMEIRCPLACLHLLAPTPTTGLRSPIALPSNLLNTHLRRWRIVKAISSISSTSSEPVMSCMGSRISPPYLVMQTTTSQVWTPFSMAVAPGTAWPFITAALLTPIHHRGSVSHMSSTFATRSRLSKAWWQAQISRMLSTRVPTRSTYTHHLARKPVDSATSCRASG